jgi:hypothetical protein
MTRAELRTLVGEYVRIEAQPYKTVAADIDTIINERLAIYTDSAHAMCIYDDAVPLTTVNGTASYDLYGASVTKRVTYPVAVTINGVLLTDYWGNPSPIGYEELMRVTPAYQTTAAGTPLRWMMRPPTSIQLYPKPNSAFSNSFISGYVLHPALTGDSDTIQLPISLERPAAKFIAAALLDPRKGGSSAERYDSLIADAMQAAAEWRNASIMVPDMVHRRAGLVPGPMQGESK